MPYAPSPEILEKYADLLVNFALNSGKGVKAKETVFLRAPLSTLPLYTALSKSLIKAGAHVIPGLSDDTSGMARFVYENAQDYQLQNFFAKYYRGLVDEIDHYIGVLGDHDPHELNGVNPKKIVMSKLAGKKLNEWLDEKENAGKFTWTLALFGTPAMAKEAGLSIEEYWQQIIKGCYLDKANPIAEWKKISAEVQRVAEQLTIMQIEWVQMTGKNCDIKVKVGKNRKWMGGSGRNIPSFEVFTSPDWRGTEGWVNFDQPVYHFGTVIRDIGLEFKAGRVVKATASKNQKLLREVLATDQGASQLGEFSLTDRRLSRIDKFMAETLFDENTGGRYGNSHMAVGRSFPDTYTGELKTLTKAKSKALGFNDSAIHNDIVLTSNRKVVATLQDGSQRTIYNDGQFTI